MRAYVCERDTSPPGLYLSRIFGFSLPGLFKQSELYGLQVVIIAYSTFWNMFFDIRFGWKT